MSAIQTFKRCGKKYEIMYKKLLDGVQESPALETGRNFHKLMEEYAKADPRICQALLIGEEGSIEHVASEYVLHNGFPKNECHLLVEEPIYVEVLPDVFIRCTMDLVYKRGDTIVIRDYKTFSKFPSVDVDLDFQARVYIALASEYFGMTNIVFEHEYVRTTPPNISKDKAGNCWSPEECYVRTELVIGEDEIRTIFRELKADLRHIKFVEDNPDYLPYTRNNIKGGGYMDCNRCSVRELCKAELQHGSLDLIDLTYLAVKREPVELPEVLQ